MPSVQSSRQVGPLVLVDSACLSCDDTAADVDCTFLYAPVACGGGDGGCCSNGGGGGCCCNGGDSGGDSGGCGGGGGGGGCCCRGGCSDGGGCCGCNTSVAAGAKVVSSTAASLRGLSMENVAFGAAGVWLSLPVTGSGGVGVEGGWDSIMVSE